MMLLNSFGGMGSISQRSSMLGTVWPWGAIGKRAKGGVFLVTASASNLARGRALRESRWSVIHLLSRRRLEGCQ